MSEGRVGEQLANVTIAPARTTHFEDINLLGTDYRTTTDAVGRATIELVLPGPYQVVIDDEKLRAVDLPDLITDTPGAYEKAAIELFHRRDRLAEFRQHLVHQREKLRLFDTDALRRHLETAYHEMWRRTEAFEAATLLAVGQVGAT